MVSSALRSPPTIANDTQATLEQARRYAKAIDRPNVMIKIPGTPEGLPAVEQAIREGIHVNVTLLFSIDSYIETFWAFIRGLEGRLADGNDINNIKSVASFFLSRIDSNIDARLNDKLNHCENPELKEKISWSQRESRDRQCQTRLPGI